MSNPFSMTCGLYNVVQSMGHGCCTTLYDPWVMGLCHVVPSMGHGKKVAERCVHLSYLRNQHARIMKLSIGSTLHSNTFKQLELEQLHVHVMGVSFHNQLLTFKRGKGMALVIWKDVCSSLS